MTSIQLLPLKKKTWKTTQRRNMKKVLLPVAIYTSIKGGFKHHWALCKAAHCQSQRLALCLWWFSRWQLENLARSRLAGHRHHRVIGKSKHLIIRMAVVTSTNMLIVDLSCTILIYIALISLSWELWQKTISSSWPPSLTSLNPNLSCLIDLIV